MLPKNYRGQYRNRRGWAMIRGVLVLSSVLMLCTSCAIYRGDDFHAITFRRSIQIGSDTEVVAKIYTTDDQVKVVANAYVQTIKAIKETILGLRPQWGVNNQ
jgi:hypothetical protein